MMTNESAKVQDVYPFIFKEIYLIPGQKYFIDNKIGKIQVYITIRSTHLNFFDNKNFLKCAFNMLFLLAKFRIFLSMK